MNKRKNTTEYTILPWLITVPEAADILGIGKSKVYDLMANEGLPKVKFGTAVRIHTHELIFTIRQESDMSVMAYEADMSVAWKRAAAHEGLRMNEHGYKLDKTYGAVADYVTKFGHELFG